MKTWVSVLLIVSLGISLVGCSTTNSSSPTDSSKAYIGMFSGAIIGGLGGAAAREKGGGRLNYIAVGALLGALVGGGLGMILDEKDQVPATHTVAANSGPQDKTFRVTTSDNKSTHQQTKQPAVASNKAKPAKKNITMNDKLLDLWKSLPSTQWFFDNGKQIDVG